MNAVILPPDLERFAEDAVARGRFRDMAEVVRAGVSLLQRAALLASVLAAEEEGEREGGLTGDEVEARVLAGIARRSAFPA